MDRLRCSTRAVLVAAALGLMPTSVHALDPRKAMTQYSARAWSTDEGLPQSSAMTLAQTPDGYLWIGTEEGLARFDGVRFEVFGPHNAPGLSDTVVTGLGADAEGALWITLRRGLARYRDGTFTTYGVGDGLPANNRCFVLDAGRAHLWLGTPDGLYLFEAGRFLAQGARLGLPPGRVTAVRETRDGSVWVAVGGQGLFHWREGRLRRYGKEEGVPDARLSFLHEDAQGRLWMASWGAGLARWEQGRIAALALGEGAERVYEVISDRDGNVWLAGAEGVLRYSGDRLEALPAPGRDIGMALLEDREGNVWAGLRAGGLLRLSDSRFTVFARPEGLHDDLVTSVFEDVDGDLWVGTETGGVTRLCAGKTQTYTTDEGLVSDVVNAVWRDRQGALWVGTDRGVQRLRDGQRSTLTRRQGLADDEVTAVLEDRQGDVWIGTPSGLCRWRGGRLRTYTHRDGLASDDVSGLYEGKDGALWILSREGLTRRHGDRFTTYGAADGLRSSRVLAVHDDGETVWIGTLGGGLARLKDGRITSYLPPRGLPTDKVAHILEDESGHLWMSSNKGVLRVAKADLHALAEGRPGQLPVTTYGRADGMRSPECRVGGWRSRDGRLWFLTIKGVAVVDPAHLEPRTLPPPVVLERMQVNGRAAAMHGGLELAAGSALELVYTGLALSAPEMVRFRYRLFGFDRDWQDAGTRRAAYYTNLPPGRYRFQVLAGTHEEVWNDTGAALEFRILPRFHQTWWFAGLAVAAALGGAFALHRFKVTLLEARNAVLEERNRIAREVHDGVAQGIGGIAMQLEAARGAGGGQHDWHVERARTLADETLTELRRSLSALRPALLDGLSLPEALERFIEPFAAGAGVEVRLHVRGAEAAMDDALASDLLRMTQEALYNAVRHGRPRRIDVRLAYEAAAVCLRVADDGAGFRAGGRPGSGLRNMRERAARLGGRVRVASEPGNGTELTIVLPLRGRLCSTLCAVLRRLRFAPVAERPRSA